MPRCWPRGPARQAPRWAGLWRCDAEWVCRMHHATLVWRRFHYLCPHHLPRTPTSSTPMPAATGKLVRMWCSSGGGRDGSGTLAAPPPPSPPQLSPPSTPFFLSFALTFSVPMLNLIALRSRNHTQKHIKCTHMTHPNTHIKCISRQNTTWPAPPPPPPASPRWHYATLSVRCNTPRCTPSQGWGRIPVFQPGDVPFPC